MQDPDEPEFLRIQLPPKVKLDKALPAGQSLASPPPADYRGKQWPQCYDGGQNCRLNELVNKQLHKMRAPCAEVVT